MKEIVGWVLRSGSGRYFSGSNVHHNYGVDLWDTGVRRYAFLFSTRFAAKKARDIFLDRDWRVVKVVKK